MNTDQPEPPGFASEGDRNVSPHRGAWVRDTLDASTCRLHDEDAKYFLHQSLSTPCLDALAGRDGVNIEDLRGNRLLDFHGNSVHPVGFGHPRVIEAITQAEMDEALDVLDAYLGELDAGCLPSAEQARRLIVVIALVTDLECRAMESAGRSEP
jgi:hypothetical protein